MGKISVKDCVIWILGGIGAYIIASLLFGLIKLTSGLWFVLAVVFIGIWVVNLLKRRF